MAASSRPGVHPWTLAGGLLLGSVLFVLLQAQVPHVAWTSLVGDAAFAGALTLFALGIGGQGRIFASGGVGVDALLALAFWPLAFKIAVAVLPSVPAELAALPVLGYIAALGQFVLAVAVAAAIGRGGRIPPRWRWVPLFAALIVALAWVLRELVTPAGATAPVLFEFVAALYVLISAGATMFLGGAAIALAGWGDDDAGGPGVGLASDIEADQR